MLGSLSAPVALVEYGDYECPFCRQAHFVMGEVIGQVGDRMLYVYRHFPLTQLHPHARRAAEAAEAAGAQGRFWEMHGTLFENQHMLDDASLLEQAVALGLDPYRFTRELAAEIYAGRVREDFMSGVRSGVNGTPTFFINNQRHDGPWDPESLMAAMGLTAYARSRRR